MPQKIIHTQGERAGEGGGFMLTNLTFECFEVL